MSKEKEKNLKGLSKAIYILAAIVRVISWIGFAVLLIVTVITPVLASKVKVTESTIELGDKTIEYYKEDSDLIIKYKEDSWTFKGNDAVAIETLLTKIRELSVKKIAVAIEVSLVCALASLVLNALVFKKLGKLFHSIHDSATPFKEEHPAYLRQMGYYMIAIFGVSILSSLLTSIIVGVDFSINTQSFDILAVLVIFALSYIFEYGYSKEANKKAE